MDMKTSSQVARSSSWIPGLGLGVGLLALSSCGVLTFSAGARKDLPCQPGQLGCICDENQRCEGTLSCVATRCVDLSGLLTQGEPSASGEQGSGGADSEQEGGSAPKSTSEGTGDTASTGAQGSSEDGVDSEPGESSQEPKDKSDASDEPSCSDGLQNQKETDVDCGGGVCPPCELDRRCVARRDCASGVCSAGSCVKCVVAEDCGPQGPCSEARCDDGSCVWLDVGGGTSCDDGDPCTVNDICEGAECRGNDTRVLVDSFDKGLENWVRVHESSETLSMWEVGEAKASSCGGKFGEDPAQDHTQNGKNGVAGVRIGACQDRHADGHWDCLWTRDLDVSFFTELPVFSFWRHLHAPARGPRSSGSISRLVYRINGIKEAKVLKAGFRSDINDSKWEHFRYELPEKAETVAIGFCYQKAPGGSPDFAGWSLDDFKLRQAGCEMDD